MIGFCFGGGMTWSMLNAGEPRLAVAAPFYGPGVDGADFSKSTAAVLGVYAENDGRVNASRDAMEAALTKAGLVHEIKTFPGVGHAFFNDTGNAYNPTQAEAAYADLMSWFAAHLD
jgi:carboxymethylenebutenolidase